MDLSQIVDVLCRAWSPEYDQPRTVRDDFTLTGLSPAEKRALRMKMRRLAKQAVLPLLQAGRPLDASAGLLVERRRPGAHAAFQRAATEQGGFRERRNARAQ